nr:PREDICTED: uncharacterized protein LOC102207545 [Pundamilia nyererei]
MAIHPDDDDSKSQDKIEGAFGGQRTTTATVVAVGAAGGSGVSSDIQDLSGSAAAEISDVSTALIHSAGSAGAGSETNSNGQKLLNGGGGGGVGSQTDAVGFFQGDVSHLGLTGSIEPSSHDFLLGMMGGDAFGPDGHVNIPGNMTAPSHLEPSGVTATPHADQNSLNSLAAETEKLVSFSDLYTDLTGGAESVTRINVNLTASGLGFGHDVTESPSIMIQTASVDVTQTHNPVSGIHPHTDLVTMTADFSGTDTGMSISLQ